MSKIYYLVRQRQKKTEKGAGLGLRERIVDVCAQDPLRVEFCRRIKRDDAFRLKTLGCKERSADEYVRMYKSRAKVGKFIKSEDQMMTTELYELGHIEAKLSRGRNKVTVLMKDGKTRTIDTTVHNDPPLVCTYDHQHDGHVDKIPDEPKCGCGCEKKAAAPCPCETPCKEETKPATIVDSVAPPAAPCPCKKEEPKCGCEKKEETKPALIKKPCEKTPEEPCPKLHDPEIVDELPCDKAAETARFRSLRSNGGKKVHCGGNKRL